MRIIKHFGPPGTGKTRRLMGVVEAEVASGRRRLPDIAYLSFSRAAAEVIKQRMNASDRDIPWFRTIHGAACKQLGMAGGIMGWQDYKAFSAQTRMKVTPDDQNEYDYGGEIDFNPVLKCLNLSLTTSRPLRDVVRDQPDHPNLATIRVEAFVAAWTKWKADNNKFDFMDMLVRYDRDGEPLPINFALLDEAQDLSDLQWRCFHKMTANAEEIHMAGDDDQSIFGFIGASEYGFLEHPCDEENVIRQSWRVGDGVGRVADKVIRKIAHRKDKDVAWRDGPGSVSRINLSVNAMPWARWLKDYHNPDHTSIMVLTRHRRGAADFSGDLKAMGIPHSFQGETLNSWSEARVLHSLYALKDGKKITPRAAIALAEALGKPTASYRQMGVRDKVSVMPGVDLKSVNWLDSFATNRRARERYGALLNLIRAQGYEALAVEPKIVVQTMHSSKGDEANLIIVVPDCTNVVKRNADAATEIRLAYVALTRAKRDVAVLVPRTETFISHFF